MKKLFVDLAPMETMIFIIDDEKKIAYSRNFMYYGTKAMSIDDIVDYIRKTAWENQVNEIIVIGGNVSVIPEKISSDGFPIPVTPYQNRGL